jgi:hypothetical protein
VKKAKGAFGYNFIKKTKKKRPQRHSKRPNKKFTKKKSIGQGKP